jgi:hypothetical protein
MVVFYIDYWDDPMRKKNACKIFESREARENTNNKSASKRLSPSLRGQPSSGKPLNFDDLSYLSDYSSYVEILISKFRTRQNHKIAFFSFFIEYNNRLPEWITIGFLPNRILVD